MNKEFINWLSEQKYNYYEGDPLNNNTTQNWVIDEVVKFSVSFSVINWDELIELVKSL